MLGNPVDLCESARFICSTSLLSDIGGIVSQVTSGGAGLSGADWLPYLADRSDLILQKKWFISFAAATPSSRLPSLGLKIWENWVLGLSKKEEFIVLQNFLPSPFPT